MAGLSSKLVRYPVNPRAGDTLTTGVSSGPRCRRTLHFEGRVGNNNVPVKPSTD